MGYALSCQSILVRNKNGKNRGKENGIENCFFERVSWKVGKVDQKKGFHFFKVGGIGAKKFG